MRLAEDDSAPGQARRYVRRWADEKRVSRAITADIELVVTELDTTTRSAAS
ncbi:MAG: hypothetical protein ABI658_02900 [Acidimicrobiales bacterium]